jgi:hypothetical protein
MSYKVIRHRTQTTEYELNDKEELQALAESIKAVYYQDYKTAYSSNSTSTSTCKSTDDKEEEEVIIDKSHFDHII